MVQKLDELGFRINFKKSVLIPSKRIVFFGLIIDTELFKIFLTDEKIDKIISLGKVLLKQKFVTVRCLASFIGLVVHAFNAVSVGPLHYRNMERNKVEALNSCNGDFDSEIFITEESKTEFIWWVNNIKSENGKLIRPIQINFWIETDASLEVALTSAARAQSLSALDLHNISFSQRQGTIVFHIQELLKSTRPGISLPNVVFKRFDKPELCVVKTMIRMFCVQKM
ncbi:unnamed protein product [Mytilus coruscus]|uniref:Reverse transcriptase domain-containing protein n=1 Tax=Mytilus coruscus TaxID=42192 RepID=A0A6J8AGI7_MYTCO|nr:unnamed protein product [Mytilus coruscus]